jgi:hypothetical protein
MPKPRKNAKYDASAELIRKYFAESWDARDEQKAASKLITALNSEMEGAGVHPGVMSWMRSIKAMPDGKRGFHLFLLRRYADVLEQELHDATFQPPAEAAVRPFAQRTAAA